MLGEGSHPLRTLFRLSLSPLSTARLAGVAGYQEQLRLAVGRYIANTPRGDVLRHFQSLCTAADPPKKQAGIARGAWIGHFPSSGAAASCFSQGFRFALRPYGTASAPPQRGRRRCIAGRRPRDQTSGALERTPIQRTSGLEYGSVIRKRQKGYAELPKSQVLLSRRSRVRRAPPDTATDADLEVEASGTSHPQNSEYRSTQQMPASCFTVTAPQRVPVFVLCRRPLFPGFRQVLNVEDTQVIHNLRKMKEQGIEILGAFFQRIDNRGSSTSTVTRDIGPASFDLSKTHDVGTLIQIIDVVPASESHGPRVLVAPLQRIRRLTEDPGAPVPSEPDGYREDRKDLSSSFIRLFLGGVGSQIVGHPLESTQLEGTSHEESPPKSSSPLVKEVLFEEFPNVCIEPWQDDPPGTISKPSQALKLIHMELLATLHQLLQVSPAHKLCFEQILEECELKDTKQLIDLASAMSYSSGSELQKLLEQRNIERRASLAVALLKQDLEIAKLQCTIKQEVDANIAKDQKKYVLTEHLKVIKQELGLDKDGKSEMIQKLRQSVENKTLPAEASTTLEYELGRLSSMDPSSAEYHITRGYAEWLTRVPWNTVTEDNINIDKAKSILDTNHEALEDVKKRLLEFMAVNIMGGHQSQGKVICLVGPPGVGKTSIVKAMADALEKKLYKISLGGLCDVAELYGHRRTYIGAMPGKFVHALKSVGCMNPVILLDEIDKMGNDYRGDPGAVLLEVLDPSQNGAFRDHYMDVAVDLSKVLFVCTANSVEGIRPPLLDRMELIHASGYTLHEKIRIARNHLVPRILKETGVERAGVSINENVRWTGSSNREDTALFCLVAEYTREAGVRGLQKCLEKLGRKMALQILRKEPVNEIVVAEALKSYLGAPIGSSTRLYENSLPGVAMGLAYTELGGAVLFIECCGFNMRRTPHEENADPCYDQEPLRPSCRIACLKRNDDAWSAWEGRVGPFYTMETSASLVPKKVGNEDTYAPVKEDTGYLSVTGRLGPVMSESTQIAYFFARCFLKYLSPENDYFDRARIHMHIPEAATPKDGPSAGITMASALLSLALNTPVVRNLAMTGELTLTGKVIRVGGIKEKTLAAQREGAKTIVFPLGNQSDYEELGEDVKEGITAYFVETYFDVFSLAFSDSLSGNARQALWRAQRAPGAREPVCLVAQTSSSQ